ncbi:hypothetical protein JYP52_01570 [Nitratireductor aquibiodomus]|uniref:hypothetical protein n=1 Tax=Nitratireductor aquibiodomus TaxID=204799 RepID=UPI0019D3D226|nr:hypothetical protein [Nitratireductor aquibiodomus]MBN7759812.1 hypothetical protein [Nitratireductor aquibiodomus]
MTKNTGKPSEQEFERIWDRLGKSAWYWRVVDAAEVRGRTGKSGFTRSAPSDYVVAHDGIHFAEVKSTQDDTAFRFSLLRTKPSAMAKMIVTAGGDYFVYIHRMKTGEWFKVPFSVIDNHPKRSLTWPELKEYKWTLNTPTS